MFCTHLVDGSVSYGTVQMAMRSLGPGAQVTNVIVNVRHWQSLTLHSSSAHNPWTGPWWIPNNCSRPNDSRKYSTELAESGLETLHTES